MAHMRILRADGTLHADIPPVESHSAISPRGCYEPSFTPDEKFLIYVRSDIQPLSNLFLWNLATNQQSALTTDGSDNQSPRVSPEGRHIVFVATRPNQSHMVFQMNLPASPAKRK